MSEVLELYNVLKVRTASSWDARARRKLQSVGAEAFGTHQVEDWPVVCFNPMVLYPQLSTISKVLALQSIVHPSCPLAVQTSPYFLFNSFASRKSDSNTSPRKHKYASAGAAFYKLCQYYTSVHCLRRNSDLKVGFPESINSSLLPRLCLT